MMLCIRAACCCHRNETCDDTSLRSKIYYRLYFVTWQVCGQFKMAVCKMKYQDQHVHEIYTKQRRLNASFKGRVIHGIWPNSTTRTSCRQAVDMSVGACPCLVNHLRTCCRHVYSLSTACCRQAVDPALSRSSTDLDRG